MTSTQNFSGRVTIRLPPEKLEIYQEFKYIVTEVLHSDICYVIGELLEAFVNAVKQVPNPDSKITLTFAKQNIQINMGCNFNYNVKKPKRLPHQNCISEESLKISKNYVLPNLIEQWPTLKPRAQEYWRQALTEAGILALGSDSSHVAGSNPAGPLGSNRSRATQSMEKHHKTLSREFKSPLDYHPTQDCDKCHTQLRRLNNFLWRQANGFQWK